MNLLGVCIQSKHVKVKKTVFTRTQHIFYLMDLLGVCIQSKHVKVKKNAIY